jgi:hypothetical protein
MGGRERLDQVSVTRGGAGQAKVRCQGRGEDMGVVVDEPHGPS